MHEYLNSLLPFYTALIQIASPRSTSPNWLGQLSKDLQDQGTL